MKTITARSATAAAAVALLLASHLLAARPTAPTPEERITWFRHDKFGMFIHLGPYSALAGEWRGHQIPVGTEAEWIMQRLNIPVGEYREMAHSFNPQKFNAAEWVALAKSTGMKYVILTTKHHDGFAMYHSHVSQYNISEWTGFQRDPLAELAAECRKAGLRLGVYYSHREDWDHPDGYGNNWDYDRDRKQFSRYLEEKSKPQVREILSGYGPISVIWFDRGMDTPEHAAEFVDLVRKLQPQCLINGRVGNYGQDLMGDYQNLGDNGMPPGGLDEYWETPQTLNGTWGYSKFDQEWKTPAFVIQRLVEIASKGGNYLLNIGPRGDGSLPEASVAVLHAVGNWMQKNGDSIYGTSACPIEPIWGRCTVKNDRLYLHVFHWPADGVLRVSGLNSEARVVYPLLAPDRRLTVRRDHGVTLVDLPREPRDENDTVFVLETVGPPRVEPTIITQGSDIPFELDYMTAQTSGRAAKRFNRDGKFHISKWMGPGDTASWRLLVSQTGIYKVKVRYAAPTSWQGTSFSVTIGGPLPVQIPSSGGSIGDQSLKAKVEATGEWFVYKTFELGDIHIDKAGQYTLTIRPETESNHYLMYLQSVSLEPPIIMVE